MSSLTDRQLLTGRIIIFRTRKRMRDTVDRNRDTVDRFRDAVERSRDTVDRRRGKDTEDRRRGAAERIVSSRDFSNSQD